MATLRPVGSKSNQALLNAEYKIAPIIPDSRCLQTFEMQSSKKALAIHLFRKMVQLVILFIWWR